MTSAKDWKSSKIDGYKQHADYKHRDMSAKAPKQAPVKKPAAKKKRSSILSRMTLGKKK